MAKDLVVYCATGFVVKAAIVPYSKKALVADSVLVYFKAGSQTTFTPLKMNKLSGDTYTANIPSQYKDATVSYYIHAKDLSSRSENHPYIGAPTRTHFSAIIQEHRRTRRFLLLAARSCSTTIPILSQPKQKFC